MRKSNIIIKKVRNLMILSMAVIVIISVYFNISNSRAKETTDIVVNVTDEAGEVDSQKVTLVATGNKNGNYEISLPETISNVYVSNYKTLNGDKSANDKIILSQDEVKNKEINLEVNYDKKNVTSTETNEEMTLYKQNLEYDDKGIYVEGYMPLLAQINVIQNENDISLEILYTVVESNNMSTKEIYVPSEYEQTLKITLNKKMYMVEQSLISSTDAEYIVVEQSNSELVINNISSNTIDITNEEVPTIISSQYNGEDNKYYFAGGPIANSQIESIKFVTKPKEVLGTKWDASENGDNSVIAGYIDSNGNELYEIYVASNSDKTTKVYTPEDASYMFYECSNLTTIDIQNLGTSKTINMNSMFAMCTNITTLELQNLDTSNVEDMENMFFGCENLETLDISNFITAKVTTMSNMFQNCKKLTELNLKSFDTSKVIDMNSMFNGCESLTILNLNNFNTTEVTDMSWMFYNCKNITTLDLSNFDTSNVIDMSAMFSTCENLTTLNISNFNTTEVTSMNAMFSDCKKLQILNISNFNISKVEDMSFMFSGCIKLSELDLGKQFTKIANENEGIFDGLEENQLVIKVPSAIYAGKNEIKLNNGSTDIITFLDNVKVECKYKIEWKKVSSSVDIAQKQINVVLQAEGVNTTYDSAKILTDGISKYLQLYIDGKIVDNLTVTIENQEVKNGKLQCTLKIKNEEIKDGEGIALVIKEDSATDKYGNGNLEIKLIIAEPLPIMQNTQYNGDDNKYYFAGGTIENSKIESIKFVASKEEVLGTQWDASENGNNSVIAGYVDSNNNGLYEIYVASNSEKTTKVYMPEDASYMFYEGNNLTTIDLQNINTSKTINMNSMFATCNNITTLDLSSFDTSKVIDMENMFYKNEKLVTLDISSFNTSEVTTMSNMFSNCTSLTKLDLNNFNTSKVTDMNSMFFECRNLATLNISNFNTPQVTDMSYMFYNNQKLTTINVSNFNTSNTVYMGAMFSGCSAITTLDISNFDISKVEDMNSMFRRCSNLTTLDLGKKFTQIASEYGDMFDGIGSNTTLVIKVPEAIYSGEKEIRLNNTSEEKIQFSNNVTIDCKYRIDWKKISSTINTEQKQIELILQAEGINTTYSSNKLTNSNLEKYFEIYVDREKTTDINISINNQKVINNKLQCTLTLDFENAVESGEVSILIKRGTAQDQYENSNLEQKIIVDNADFIKPSIKYTYSKSDIDKDNKILTINFTATDKNLDTVASVLQKSDLSLAIYNYDSNGKGYWENVDISDANNTLTQNINGKEIDYVLTIKTLPIDIVEKYAGRSGYVTLIIPKDKIVDIFGNKNDAKTITVGINEPTGNGNNQIVDVINPIWTASNMTFDNQQGKITFKLIGTDKYFKESTLTSNKIKTFIGKDEITGTIDMNIAKTSDLTEKRDEVNTVYGIEYLVTISNVKSLYEGNLKLIINSATLEDLYGNFSKETEISSLGIVDFKKPSITKISSEVDKTAKTEKIVFEVRDNYFKASTLNKSDIKIFVDEEDTGSELTKELSEKEILDENGKKIGIKYTLLISGFEQRKNVNNKNYKNWSGTVRIEVPAEKISDEYGNYNDNTSIDGDFVDVIKPSITYKYLTTDIQGTNDSVKIVFDITDKYYSLDELKLEDLAIKMMVDDERYDILTNKKVGISFSSEDITNTINITKENGVQKGQLNQVVGKRYTLILSNLSKLIINDNRPTLDYSGFLSISIPKDKVQDTSENKNIAQTITVGTSIDGNETNGGSVIVDTVKPIWKVTENNKQVDSENTSEIVLQGTDTYYLRNTLTTGRYNATEIMDKIKIYVDGIQTSNGITIEIGNEKALKENRTIDGKTEEVQYGVEYNVKISGYDSNAKFIRIEMQEGTLVDKSGNLNNKTQLAVLNTLKSAVIDKDSSGVIKETSKFLGGNIKRNQIEKIKIVTSLSEVKGTTWDVSSSGDNSILAGYIDEDNNGKYEIYIGSDFNIFGNTDSSWLFAQMTNLKVIEGLNNLYTINVKDMSHMFDGNKVLSILQLSNNFNTKSVTNMSHMFEKCEIISELDLGPNFDTSNVKNMQYMFAGNKKMSSIIGINKFNTSNVINMSGLFKNCNNIQKIDLGNNFDTTNVTNMDEMFFNCTNISEIDLGIAFNRIAESHTNFTTNCGTNSTKIYVGEAIYSNEHKFRLNNSSSETIEYNIGTIICKYQIKISKISSSVNVNDGTLTVKLKATGYNTTYSLNSLDESKIGVYVNNEKADSINKTVNATEVSDGIEYTIVLSNFEQSTFQNNKTYKEWSGNVSLKITEGVASDKYGHRNLETEIKDDEKDRNTENFMFADFIKPSIIYRSANTEINTENKVVTIKFDVRDKYYASSNINLSDIIMKIYNEASDKQDKWEQAKINNSMSYEEYVNNTLKEKGYEGVTLDDMDAETIEKIENGIFTEDYYHQNIETKFNTLSFEADQDGYGGTYTLQIKNLEQEMGKLYKNYSGYISFIIPEGKILDKSGNKNISKTITLGINDPKIDENEQPIIVDVVNPTFKIENTNIDKTKGEITLDIVGTDKYYLENTLTLDKIHLFVDDEETEKIQKQFVINNGETTEKANSYAIPLYENREGKQVQYGIKYHLKLSGISLENAQNNEETENGKIDMTIDEGVIKDKSGNINSESKFEIGAIDTISPKVNKISSSIDKVNETAEIKFSITDKHIIEPNTYNNYRIYIDEEDITDSVNQKIEKEQIIKTNSLGKEKIVGYNYTITLSNFEQRRKTNGKNYKDWSGTLRLEIAEGTAVDEYENKNKTTSILGEFVDFTKPYISYKYSENDIDRNRDIVKLVFDVTDKYYDARDLTLDDLLIKIKVDDKRFDILNNDNVNVNLESKEIRETINKTINGKVEINKENQLVGKEYTLTISNLSKAIKGEDRKTLDYSGILSVLINDVEKDTSENINNKTTLTVGVSIIGTNETNGEEVIVDTVKPIWEKQENAITNIEANNTLSSILIKGTDTYYSSNTLNDGEYSATQLLDKIKVFVDNQETTSGITINIKQEKVLEENRENFENYEINKAQYGVVLKIEVKGFSKLADQVKIKIMTGTLLDSSGNINIETEFIMYTCLKETNKEISFNESTNSFEDNGFLGNTSVKRNKIEKITFVNSIDQVKGTTWNASANGDNSIIAGYEDSDSNGYYEIYIGSNENIYGNINSSYLFAGMENLKNIVDMNNLYMSNATNIDSLYFGDKKLQNIELGTNFKTNNVTNMDNLFRDCETLNGIKLNSEFNTSKVKTMKNMFRNCKNVETLSLGIEFDTTNVTNMSNMFNGLEKIKNINLENKFNTTNVTNMEYMFANCKKLKGINFTDNFNTSNVENMRYMFYNCNSSEYINFGENFNTEKVKDMSYMFAENNTLSSIQLPNEFNTKSVVNMNGMFYNCNNADEINLGSKFYTIKANNMNNMFEKCSKLVALDLGPAFTNIANSNANMLKDCGKSANSTIYCGEAIYGDVKNLRLNSSSSVQVNYLIGRIECKYRIEWSKVSSILDKENKKLIVTIKAEGINTIYKEGTATLTERNIHVYVDGELADDGINVVKTLNSGENITGGVQYILTLENFEQQSKQTEKKYCEWSGNVSVQIDRGIAFDEYGNGNLMNEIKDEQVTENTDGKMFVDFIKPEITYKYSKADINYDDKTLEVVLKVYDKYIGRSELTTDDITAQIYNEETKKYDTIENVLATINTKYTDNELEIRYQITNLSREFIEKYANYSGYISIIVPENKIFDMSGNGNIQKIITIGINNPDNTGENVIVDVVDPVWHIENVRTFNKNKGETTEDSYVLVDLIGTDKYLSKSTLSENDLSISIDGEIVSTISKKLVENTNGKKYEEMYETIDGTKKLYGVKYTLKLSNFEAGEEVTDREFAEWSGSTTIMVEPGCLEDISKNTNKKTSLGIGIVDFIRPEFVQQDLTSTDIMLDKIKKTQTIKLSAYDKFMLPPTDKELEKIRNSIILYVDSEIDRNVTKKLEYIENKYVLTLSDFKDGGNVEIQIPENVTTDKYGNGNKESIIKVVVDEISPTINYEYSKDETNKEEKKYTMEFSVYDRHYNDSSRITLNNLNTIRMGKYDLKNLSQLSQINLALETDEENDKVFKMINGEKVLVGRKYRLVISNIDKENGIEYTGAVTIVISANSVLDKYTNGNIATTITSGVYTDENGNKTPEEIVDVVSPVIKTANLKIRNETMTITFEVKDSSGINETTSKLIDSKTRNIDLSLISLIVGDNTQKLSAKMIGNVEDIVNEENKNIGFTFTIEMPKIQDIDNAYLLFPQGIVEDTKGNQNNLTKIVLSTKLLAVGNETGPNSGFLGNTSIKRKDIQSVEFVNNVIIPVELQGTKWDVSQSQDGSITAWYRETENGKYEVYIGSEFEINANTDSSYLFANIGSNCTEGNIIRNLKALNTSNTTNMSHMFENFGNSSMTKLELGETFDISKVTDMTKMFYNCGKDGMLELDLGPQFANIPDKHDDIITNCGKKDGVIYVGEAIYSDSTNLRLNGASNAKIKYNMGRIECKYRTKWSKISTTIDENNKKLIVVVEASGINTECDDSVLDSTYVDVYVDGEIASNITKTVTDKTKIVDKIRYTITFDNFEELILQNGKKYKEWSGNIKLAIKGRSALDKYGNGNFEDIIEDSEKTNSNLSGKLFADFIVPEIQYEASNLTTIVDTENKELIVKFYARDKYYARESLNITDLIFNVYNEAEKTWEKAEITSSQNSLTKENIENGIMYTLRIKDLEKNTGINYKNYSGAVNITIPSGKISDHSGNKNKTQSITLGINNSDDSGNKVIVDIIDPAWEIKDIQKNVQSGTITFKLIGKDKYLKETNLTTNSIKIFMDNIEMTNNPNLKKDISTGNVLYEKRDNKLVKYAVEYTVTIRGFEEYELDKSANYQNWSGNTKIVLSEGILTDETGNTSKETTFDIGQVDFVRPIIKKISSKIDKQAKTETIEFMVTDKYFGTSNITTDSINVYVDGKIAEGINKEIIAETDVTENRNGTNYKIGKKYTLKLSNFEQKNRFGQTTDYLNWSGQTSIRIAEDVIEDTSGNKNLQETIDGEYVDFVSPAMLYNYLTTDVDYEQKSVTIKFRIVDKNYKRGNLTLDDLKILINQKEVDWNKVKRTFREEPVYSEINGQRKQIGNEYTIVISELDQTKREGTNTLDYSGIITVAINAGLIEDESGNTNNSQIITLGISQKIWDKITTYISSKNIIGSKENQRFTIQGSYDTQNINGWRLLGTTEDGKLMIVATNIVKPENKQGYEISGADGYENATEELNRIGALYGQGYGAVGGRSITLKDINKITGYNATAGETKTYNSNNVSKNGFRFFDEANNKWALLTDLFSNVTKSITNTFYEYSVNSISSKAMQTIFGSDGYWVANNSVKTNDNDVEYGMFYVNDSTVTSSNLYNSSGNSNTEQYGVRPVVILDSSVKLKGSSNSIWQIEEQGDLELTIDLNGGEYSDGDEIKTFKLNEGESWRVTLPKREKYEIASLEITGEGTSAELQRNGDYIITMGSEKSYIKVIWDYNKYSITYNTNGGKVDQEYVKAEYGQQLTISNAIREGYTLLGWSSTGDESNIDYRPGNNITIKQSLILDAIWQLNDYTLTFDGNNGSIIGDSTITGKYRTEVQLPKAERAGYTFEGWATETDATEPEYNDKLRLKENLTLYAVWKPEQFTVTFDGNGGTTNVESVTENYNAKVDLPIAERPGYTLLGWDENQEATKATYSTNSKYTIKGNTTLYAIWSINTYTITFNAGEGTVNQNTIEGTYNTEIRLPEATRKGYELLGWSEDAKATQPQYTNTYVIKENKVLYAVWSTKRYTVVLDANGGQIGDSTDSIKSITNNYLTNITLPTATREGYTFTGWSTNINAILGEYKTNYEIQDNITLYAIWTSDKYTITFNGNGGIVETETISANFNSDIILPEATRAGYTLVGWDIRASSATAKYEAGKEYTVQGNITLYAIWRANKFDIILNGNGGAFVYGNGNKIEQISYQKYASDTITMPMQETTNGYPVIQRNGYTFKGWATEAGSDVIKYQPGKTYSVSDIVANSTNLYAIWQINKYTITFNRNSSDNSIKINGESTENYQITENYLENVALPAATRNGYTLLGWSENPTDTTVDASGTVGTTVTITEDKTYYAIWEANPTEIVFYPNGGNITVNGEQTNEKTQYITRYESTINNNVSELAPSRQGYTFEGWYTSENGGSQVYGTNGKGIIGTNYWDEEGKWIYTLNSLKLYARWKEKTYTITFDPNGGNITENTKEVVYNSTKNNNVSSLNPTKTGYIFNGWYTERTEGIQVYKNNGSSNANSNTFWNSSDQWVYTDDITLYAQWTPITYTITYNGNGSTSGSTSQSSHTYDEAKKLTANGFERTGFEFVGWSTQATGSKQYSNSESVVNLSSQNGSKITLYAVWKEEEYTITFNANSGTIQEDTKKVVYSSTQNNDVSALNPTKTGYIFSGWYTSTSGGIQVYGPNGKCNVNANDYWASSKQWIYTDNITLYAQWTAITYQIVFNGNGNTSGSMTNMECKYGATYSLSANGFKKDGYEFIGWTTSANGEVVYQNQQEISNLSTINGTEINLYAKWKLILVYPSGVVLDKSSAIIDLSTNNKTVKLNATIQPSNANTDLNLTWKSDNNSIATVDGNGLVTGVANGIATITVITQNGYTAQCSVPVITSITSLAVSPTSKTLNIGETVQLTGTVTPTSTTEGVQWASSNTNVATVSSSGLVTGKNEGTATITLKNSNGNKYATCQIKVIAYRTFSISRSFWTTGEVNAGWHVCQGEVSFGEARNIVSISGWGKVGETGMWDEVKFGLRIRAYNGSSWETLWEDYESIYRWWGERGEMYRDISLSLNKKYTMLSCDFYNDKWISGNWWADDPRDSSFGLTVTYYND